MTAAFFDVDDTLIRGNSMAQFLEHHLAACGQPPGTFERLVAGLAAGKQSRADANRAYYQLFAGCTAARLAAEGAGWFTRATFQPDVLAALRAHQEQGDRVFLVSGSFFACLDPVAAAVDADRAYGTRPVIRDGVLTGAVRAPMVDGTKARLVRLLATTLALDLSRCAAYGDHESDLPMLREVGHPVVVGDDPVLTDVASRRGWRRISVDSTPAAVVRADRPAGPATGAPVAIRGRPGPVGAHASAPHPG